MYCFGNAFSHVHHCLLPLRTSHLAHPLSLLPHFFFHFFFSVYYSSLPPQVCCWHCLGLLHPRSRVVLWRRHHISRQARTNADRTASQLHSSSSSSSSISSSSISSSSSSSSKSTHHASCTALHLTSRHRWPQRLRLQHHSQPFNSWRLLRPRQHIDTLLRPPPPLLHNIHNLHRHRLVPCRRPRGCDRRVSGAHLAHDKTLGRLRQTEIPREFGCVLFKVRASVVECFECGASFVRPLFLL